MATERLRRSRAHRTVEDRAIDLGIAIEVIFLHDIKGGGELKYRTALRAASFLGQQQGSKSAVFKTIASAYDARSAAVHNSRIAKQTLIDALPLADQLCVSAIIQIIKDGQFPDWEILVLGEPAQSTENPPQSSETSWS